VDWSQAGVVGGGDKWKSEQFRYHYNWLGIRCCRVMQIVCFVFDGGFS